MARESPRSIDFIAVVLLQICANVCVFRPGAACETYRLCRTAGRSVAPGRLTLLGRRLKRRGNRAPAPAPAPSSTPRVPMTSAKIDVHFHVIPPFYRDAVYAA